MKIHVSRRISKKKPKSTCFYSSSHMLVMGNRALMEEEAHTGRLRKQEASMLMKCSISEIEPDLKQETSKYAIRPWAQGWEQGLIGLFFTIRPGVKLQTLSISPWIQDSETLRE
jgi:hypothetical protein